MRRIVDLAVYFAAACSLLALIIVTPTWIVTALRWVFAVGIGFGLAANAHRHVAARRPIHTALAAVGFLLLISLSVADADDPLNLRRGGLFVPLGFMVLSRSQHEPPMASLVAALIGAGSVFLGNSYLTVGETSQLIIAGIMFLSFGTMLLLSWRSVRRSAVEPVSSPGVALS
jgi:hypothetical protein